MKSNPIFVDKSFLDSSSIQIICELNERKLFFNRIKIERNIDSIYNDLLKDEAITNKNKLFLENKTISFPVCKIPSYKRNSHNYSLSVCTYMHSSSVKNFVEWIEYHRSIG